MSAIGKIQAAWAAASNEITVTLANLNFDFSLIKVEAPLEFRELGAALSTKRRSAAEHGTSHMTARKLGSLFEQVLPPTPRLFKAYGLRASKIAQSPLVNPKRNKDYGPFAEHIGVDATSIWAAATSGSSALAVHLLACMLARIWSTSEAIGIWEQILAARKRELLELSESGAIHLQSLAAAELSLSREQLADWDASARAWLRAADAVEKIRQKQLILIVENLNIPVNRNMDVYASVMHAWKTAMITMDKLVGGMGHSVQDGSVLLGLSSWHLYPDMLILGNVNAETKQDDNLIAPGGIVTIGLQGVDRHQDRGVYWSLPLAHVRFYGDPVKAEGSITLDSSRVSIDQLLMVALGSVLATWPIRGSTLEDSLQLISLMWRCSAKEIAKCPDVSNKAEFLEFSWLKVLSDSSIQYLTSNDSDQSSLRRLINLGQRRAHLFSLSKTKDIFGLTGAALVRMIKDYEKKVLFLRKLAAKYKSENDSLVIRICRASTKDSQQNFRNAQMDFATAVPEEIRGLSQTEKQYRHKRWTENTRAPSEFSIYTEDLIQYNKESIEALQNLEWFSWDDPPQFFRNVPLTEPDHVVVSDQTKRRFHYKLTVSSRSSRTNTNQKAARHARFEYLYGDLNSVALFRRSDREVATDEGCIGMPEIAEVFTSNAISPNHFLHHLTTSWNLPDKNGEDGTKLQDSLRALATMAKVYKSLPNATVPLSIISFGPLSDALWVPTRRYQYHDAGDDRDELEPSTVPPVLLPFELTRPATFSCIAMFESGGFNFLPEFLDRVMAISVGDSIYVAAPLLCDPSIQPAPHEVQRIAGNIGRAGLALLIPPVGPKTKQIDVGSYQFVNHDSFDGKLEDSFQSTSLHLAFSGYELPLDVGEHGGRNREAFFLESLVSVHDRGEWIADLDILSTFASPKFQCIVDQPSCLAGRPRPIPKFPLVSIDSWHELLDLPLDVAVVRARDNWLGRLAAVSVSISLGYRTILFTGSACWKCGEKTVAQIMQQESYIMDDDNQASPKIVFIL